MMEGMKVASVAAVAIEANESVSEVTPAHQLSRQQQLMLIYGQPLGEVLSAAQMRQLHWRKRLQGEVDEVRQAPTGYLHGIRADGELTLMFAASTLAPEWYVHVYVHATSAALCWHKGSRSKKTLFGCVSPRANGLQQGGLLADIHLVADGLSELTVVHEAVHAAGYLARLLGVLDAKKLAAPFVSTQSTLIWREEIQCRTVERLSWEIVNTLHALRVPCTALRSAEL